MKIYEPAATFEEGVDISSPLVVPVAMLEEHDDVGLFEFFGRRPFPSSGDAHVLGRREQVGPDFLPGRIIVLADAVVFRSSDEQNMERPRLCRRVRRTSEHRVDFGHSCAASVAGRDDRAASPAAA